MLGCVQCAFNFDGVCAAAKYGEAVNEKDLFECEEWKMSLEYFNEISELGGNPRQISVYNQFQGVGSQ